MPSRRRFLASGAATVAAIGLPAPLAACAAAPGAPPMPEAAAPTGPVTVGDIASAETVAGLRFRPEQRALMLDDVNERLATLATIREHEPANGVAPLVPGAERRRRRSDPAPMRTYSPPQPSGAARPADRDLAFASIDELGALLRGGVVTSVELTELALERLRRFDPQLKAVVTRMEERAMRTARERDDELRRGRLRGPLHGIPYGAKDLLAARGAPTTWGATPYREQEIDDDAAVVAMLERAGAVLVAKLSLGALAWGDVWFGGRTNSPWNVEAGSSGSSAGPGAAVAAGLVPFAIGSETYGSIVSPSTRNGITGLRPTFGAVDTAGAMALAWSLDKLGPMTRSAADAGLVLAALTFTPPQDPAALTIGHDPSHWDDPADAAALDALRAAGATLVAAALPEDDRAAAVMDVTVAAEAAAAFDGLTRSGGVDALVRQERYAWPNVFRHGRLIPAVEYVNAQRIRRQLSSETEAVLREIDAWVGPSFAGSQLALTNLTGHPAVCVPSGFDAVEGAGADDPRRTPRSITFVSRLQGDASALRAAELYQSATDWHSRRPPVS